MVARRFVIYSRFMPDSRRRRRQTFNFQVQYRCKRCVAVSFASQHRFGILSDPPGQRHTGSILAGGSTRSQFECAVHPASTMLRLCQSALRSGSCLSMCIAACRSASEGQCHAFRPFSFHAAQHTAASVCSTSGTPMPPSTAGAASETAGSEDRGPDGKTPDWASPGEVITYTRSSGGRYLPSPCA